MTMFDDDDDFDPWYDGAADDDSNLTLKQTLGVLMVVITLLFVFLVVVPVLTQ